MRSMKYLKLIPITCLQVGRRRCLGENFGKAVLFVFVANLITRYEIGLDDSMRAHKTKFDNEKAKHSETSNEDDIYDLEQIHDLGFTLTPKPFNLVLRRRKQMDYINNLR